MKYIDEIKNAIAEVIKPNGNQEITGQVLQDILVSVVGKLGQSFDDQIGENVKIAGSVDIYSAKIGTGATIGDRVFIGAGATIGGDIGNVSIDASGVRIPGYLTISCSHNIASGLGTIYLGTGLQFDESNANNLTQLPLNLKIIYDSTGITFKTPKGQIMLNYGS